MPTKTTTTTWASTCDKCGSEIPVGDGRQVPKGAMSAVLGRTNNEDLAADDTHLCVEHYTELTTLVRVWVGDGAKPKRTQALRVAVKR